ncbi:MAG TPA: sulfate adenylyltransferase [Desulfatiglandales bacterium]|nr:sulfate adenylyltransferase [Desulfatiglandales bacterium]
MAILPHGGRLLPLLKEGEDLKKGLEKAGKLPQIRITSREVSDLIMLGMGAFSPLKGFMGREDYEGALKKMRLRDGTFWPVPITLAVDKKESDMLTNGDEVCLVDGGTGQIMGLMLIEEKFRYEKDVEAKAVFQTDDRRHPGVKKLYEQEEILLGGPVKVLSEGGYPSRFPGYYSRPLEVRKIFEERGWETIAAFQVRNPIHRSHEYCTKIALELSDGLFIHPLVGALKEDDIPAEVRIRCYEVLLDKYYPRERVLMKVYPMEMRYAGPREALLHAIIRQNFGCTHLIVGRDHAGVGNYYGPFDAQKIFETLRPDDLLIKPLNIDWTFYCYRCEGMASLKTCPHNMEDRCLISGTELRRMLSRGEMPPAEFSRPEVLEILIDYYKGLKG